MNIHYSKSGISSGSLDIHFKRSDHWRHYPGSENKLLIFILKSNGIALHEGVTAASDIEDTAFRKSTDLSPP